MLHVCNLIDSIKYFTYTSDLPHTCTYRVSWPIEYDCRATSKGANYSQGYWHNVLYIIIQCDVLLHKTSWVPLNIYYNAIHYSCIWPACRQREVSFLTKLGVCRLIWTVLISELSVNYVWSAPPRHSCMLSLKMILSFKLPFFSNPKTIFTGILLVCLTQNWPQLEIGTPFSQILSQFCSVG